VQAVRSINKLQHKYVRHSNIFARLINAPRCLYLLSFASPFSRQLLLSCYDICLSLFTILAPRLSFSWSLLLLPFKVDIPSRLQLTASWRTSSSHSLGSKKSRFCAMTRANPRAVRSWSLTHQLMVRDVLSISVHRCFVLYVTCDHLMILIGCVRVSNLDNKSMVAQRSRCLKQNRFNSFSRTLSRTFRVLFLLLYCSQQGLVLVSRKQAGMRPKYEVSFVMPWISFERRTAHICCCLIGTQATLIAYSSGNNRLNQQSSSDLSSHAS
jgi:hypothetical protein